MELGRVQQVCELDPDPLSQLLTQITRLTSHIGHHHEAILPDTRLLFLRLHLQLLVDLDIVHALVTNNGDLCKAPLHQLRSEVFVTHCQCAKPSTPFVSKLKFKSDVPL